MPEPDLIELFVRPLDSLGVRYLISGSVAAMLYGEPRVTHDIDLIVLLREQDSRRFSEFYPPPEFYVPPVDVVIEEIARNQRSHFNIIHADSGLKAHFHLAKRDESHAWAFRNMKGYVIGGKSIRVAPPEYVIVRKLEYYREGGSQKHLRDIRSMLAISGDQIDRTVLGEWIERRGLQTEWLLISPG